MIKINLLPVRAAQKKERVRAQMSILVLSLVAVSLACGAEYYRMSSSLDAKRREIAAVDAQVNQLKKEIGEVSRYKKEQEALQKKLEVLQVLKDGRSGPVHLLDELNRALPDKVWLTSYSINGAAANLNGIAVNEDAVASFMERLGASPYYTGVELKGISQLVQNGIKLQKFTLACQATKPAK
ncbi:MAG: PilN domain-containing protein [Deltaproteobacteria bacterium]|nr:PilN domain-containing protein [Deltaproteobacteria bacterium]